MIQSKIEAYNIASIKTRTSKINFLDNHDEIRDKIDSFVRGKVGVGPTDQKYIDKLNSQGKSRYQYNIGPGYADSKDKKGIYYSYNGINYDAEYGDYYVWQQILDYVSENKGVNVVYVTNDAKSDFFFKLDGKTRGPNESLVSEIKKSGADNFILQDISTFLHHAEKHLNANIEEDAISELSFQQPTPNVINYMANHQPNIPGIMNTIQAIDKKLKIIEQEIEIKKFILEQIKCKDASTESEHRNVQRLEQIMEIEIDISQLYDQLNEFRVRRDQLHTYYDKND